MHWRIALLCLAVSGALQSSAQIVLLDHSSGEVAASVVAQQLESSLEAYTSYAAEDIVVPTASTWVLDSLVLFGEYLTPSGTPQPGSGIILSIQGDAGGAPGSVLYTDTLAAGADPDSNGSLTYKWNMPYTLNAGTYWIVFAARKDLGPSQTQWQCFASDSTSADTALWINPGGGFTLNNCPNWTAVTTCYGSTHPGLSMKLFGCPGPKPMITGLPTDTAVCSGLGATISVGSNTPNANFQWSDGTTGQELAVDSSGVVFITVTDPSSGCSTVDSVELTVWSSPTTLLQNDSFCAGDTLSVLASSCSTCTFGWHNGAATNSISVNEPGQIWVEVTDTSTGCISTDTAFIESIFVEPPVFHPEPPLGFCEEDDLAIEVQEGFHSYIWSTGDSSSSTVVDTEGWLKVTVTGLGGCVRSDSVWVEEFPKPAPEIEIMFSNGVFVIYVEDIFESYLWSYGHTTAVVQVDTLFNVPTTYLVVVQDSNGCVGTAQISVPLSSRKLESFELNVVPNPSFGACVVNLPAGLGKCEITLYNAQGSIIRRMRTNSPQVALDLLKEEAGSYFLVVRTQQHTFTRHLIIQ